MKTFLCDGLLAWYIRAAGLTHGHVIPNQHCRAQAKLQNKLPPRRRLGLRPVPTLPEGTLP